MPITLAILDSLDIKNVPMIIINNLLFIIFAIPIEIFLLTKFLMTARSLHYNHNALPSSRAYYIVAFVQSISIISDIVYKGTSSEKDIAI